MLWPTLNDLPRSDPPRQGVFVSYVLPYGRHKGETRPALVIHVKSRVCLDLNVFTMPDDGYPHNPQPIEGALEGIELGRWTYYKR